jgi:hypothetical protein
MSDISWGMQFLRYASPSNGARYNIIKPQMPDGEIRCLKQPPCIARKSENLSSLQCLSCHSCLGSWQRKGKAVPLQAWSGPEGSRKSRFPDFMTKAQDGGRLSTLRNGRLYPQEIHSVLISVRGWIDHRSIVRPAGICHWKITMTPLEIELATCRFVA